MQHEFYATWLVEAQERKREELTMELKLAITEAFEVRRSDFETELRNQPLTPLKISVTIAKAADGTVTVKHGHVVAPTVPLDLVQSIVASMAPKNFNTEVKPDTTHKAVLISGVYDTVGAVYVPVQYIVTFIVDLVAVAAEQAKRQEKPAE